MKKSAFFALLIAITLPMAGYLLVKHYSKDAVHMPVHYFFDSVSVNNGQPDTAWHHVQSIEFTNQFGEKVSLNDLHGKIIVMNFFFTRCPTVCPGLTKNMKRLQESFAKNDSVVQFVSISVDPEFDSAANLRKFGNRFNANFDNWWFLTGNKKEIYDFAIHEIKANIADVNIDTAFIHTEKFFLLDSNKVIRGFYDGFDTTRLSQLAGDIPTLMLERDKKSPSIFREFIPILPLIFCGIAIVLIITIILGRRKKREPENF